MKIGIMSAAFSNQSLKEVVKYASENGFQTLEVVCWPAGEEKDRKYGGVVHIDVDSLTLVKISEIKGMLSDAGVEITALGNDVTLITISYVVHLALKVAEELEKEGISVEVVDLRSLYPFDKETVLNSVKKTGRVVIAHEAYVTGGVGAEIAAIIADEAFGYLDSPIKRVGAKWAPIPFPSVLEDYVLPGTDDIKKAVNEVLE